MLDRVYQNHVWAICQVAAAQLRGGRRISLGRLRRDPKVKAAMAQSKALSKKNALYKGNEVAVEVRNQIERKTIKAVRDIHSGVKQGAIFPALGAVAIPAVAVVAPKIMRRDVMLGLGGLGVGALLLGAGPADADHDAYWIEVGHQIDDHLIGIQKQIKALF